jgi:singapore isolate B (sub-type 7) whole genome shotgun sequence assembly, scaffold_0
LLDEKDALIMQLQSQVESNKAEYYKLQLSIGEEKAKRERSLKQSEKEASAIQEQLKRLMEENESLRNQLLQQQSTHQQQEDRLRSQLKDQEASISSLTASLTASQKQLDESVL